MTTFAFTPWEQGFVFESHDNVILVWPLTREAANWLHLIVEALWPERVVFNGTAAIRLPNGRFFTAATHIEAIQKAIRAGKLPDEFRHDDFERGFVIGGKDFMEARSEARVRPFLVRRSDLVQRRACITQSLAYPPLNLPQATRSGVDSLGRNLIRTQDPRHGESRPPNRPRQGISSIPYIRLTYAY